MYHYYSQKLYNQLFELGDNYFTQAKIILNVWNFFFIKDLKTAFCSYLGYICHIKI